ncbi:MAG TPA: GNAT family N-acetyltransferase [Dehalococcoidia bacterium]|nr:GNAT family N-acetyltransferase [Dehalococcoidia bacterium]
MSERFRLEEGGLVFRTCEPSDQEQVWRLHQEGLRDTNAVVPNAQPHWDDDLKNIERTYLGEASHFWVVEEQGRLIGMLAIRGLGPGTAELKRMRVAAECRRRGLGQRLLEIAEQFCHQAGYLRIVLDTTDRMVDARHLYEMNGYTLVRRMPIPTMTMFFYEKGLA